MNMRIPSVFLVSVLMILLVLSSCREIKSISCSSPAAVTVPVLMFHDVKNSEGGTWSISIDNFRKTLLFLSDNGYTPIFFDDLVNYMDGTADLPDKPVVITLDDGYYSNYNYVLPVITELEIPVTIFLCCGMVQKEGADPNTDEHTLSKMDLQELILMQESPYVHIQSHTYALHGINTSYSTTERDNALPLEGEDKDTYMEVLSTDCVLAETVLESIGVNTQIAFSYPCGKHHPWTEEVLRSRGYRIGLTTDFHYKNKVVRGDRSQFLLLGRMNINDKTTEEDLILYLERE